MWDAEEEARGVAADAEDLHRQGHAFSQMAVLVRASFQMREFEDRFLSLGIPYRVIGGPRFYERAEIRDALAYLRLVAQGDDDLAFERIVNKPKRGIGDASVQALHQFARARGVPLLAAAREIAETDEVPPKARKSLGRSGGEFRALDPGRQKPSAYRLAEMVLDECGYTDMLKADKSPDAPGRLDNLKELVRSMEEFETLEGFLEHVSLVMELEQNESEDRVNLMTMHAAKGLEFETVFLPGWEEGLFPSQRTMDESGLAGLEEERRLAYVVPDAGQAAHPAFASPPTGACTEAGKARCHRASSTNCRPSISRRWSMRASMAAIRAFATMRDLGPGRRHFPAAMKAQAGSARANTARPREARGCARR